MSREKRSFFVGLFLIGSVILARPVCGSTTGNDLLRYCKSDADAAEQSFCLGYLHGVVDGAMAIRVSEGQAQIFEIPAGVHILQIRDVVVKFLKKNPKDRHLAAVALVFKALKEAFPAKP